MIQPLCKICSLILEVDDFSMGYTLNFVSLWSLQLTEAAKCIATTYIFPQKTYIFPQNSHDIYFSSGGKIDSIFVMSYLEAFGVLTGAGVWKMWLRSSGVQQLKREVFIYTSL